MRRVSLIIVAQFMAITLWAQQPVKNIIYLIGDGMGLASVSMMQYESESGEVIFNHADNIALQRTYSMDNRVTDSAASGTALATGSKTNNTYLGVTADGQSVENLMEVAHSKGKRTALVVTTVIQHATPAAFYAHIPARHEYVKIAKQLIDSDIDVAIGGGMSIFEELFSGSDVAHELQTKGITLVESIDALGPISGDGRTFAIVADVEVGADSGSYLADATREALRLVEGDEDGFVLMVEGSLIDGMGHGNNAPAQQVEMRGFMSAVEVAVEYADSHPGTLVVVTSDHETGGLSIVSSDANFNLAEQGIEYRWSTGGHSATMVPIYLYGTGAESINGVMENAELGAKLKSLIGD
jgi:alkaline phosphatase